jgi:hypothetical protein
VWLRREVAVPDWADTSQPAITLGTFADAWELYVDGHEIAETDSFRYTEIHMARARTVDVPPGLIGPWSKVQLIIRAWRVVI